MSPINTDAARNYMKAPLPQNESARLNALRQYLTLKSETEPLLDELTRLAAHVCLSPGAALCFVDANRLWHQAALGNFALPTEREGSFCSWVILDSKPLVIADARQDERFKNHVLVTGEPSVRFCVGAPLITAEGYALGALCAFDWQPRTLTLAQVEMLRALADAVMATLELKRKGQELERVVSECHHLEKMLQLQEHLFSQVTSQNEGLSRTNTYFRKQVVKRQQAAESIAVSEERYALAMSCTDDGIWDWNLKTNEGYYSPRWRAMLGYEEDELGHSLDEWFNRIHPEEIEVFRTDLAAHLAGLTGRFEYECRMRQRDGSYRWMRIRSVAVRDEEDKVSRMAGTLTDISGQKEKEERLQHNAFHDALTGLPNRAMFMDRLQRSLNRAKQREDYVFAVLLLDIDRFKVTNDSLGHQYGDHLLMAIARRLETYLRPGDIVARLDGDEFAILLDHLKHLDDATQAAERLQQEFVAPFQLPGHEVFTSASVGVAHSLTRYEQPEDFLRDADTAMRRAKEEGPGRVQLFDTGMHAHAVAQSQLETDLRLAISQEQFRVYYQPIILLDNWRVAGFEALLRWEHPQHGFISPIEFIPLAEETGLILPLGRWVLEESCRQLRSWQEIFPTDPPLTISVNLSGKQFAQPNLIAQVQKILRDTGLEASTLKLEITESTIIENTESATAMLTDLRKLGVRVSLDDFGTGYSSLSYLHRFPIDTLKIDRSFVTRMSLPQNSEIVRTILSLAGNLGMDVVAEGVETGDQVVQLTGMNCEYAQGYLFSQPIDAEAVRNLLEEIQQKKSAPQAVVA